MGIAAAFPLQAMMAYNYSPLELEAIATTLAPMNWVVMGVSMVHAVLVYQASTYVLVSGPLFLGAVAWNNWLVAAAGLNDSVTATIFATLGAILTQAPLLKPEIRRLILNRKLRWWRTPFRKRASLDTVIRPVLGGEMKSLTFDISEEGAFISLDQASWNPLFKGSDQLLKVGARCSVRLIIDPYTTVQCGAEIVRRTEAKGNYPGGFAVRFLNLDRDQKKMLTAFIRKPQPLHSVKAA